MELSPSDSVVSYYRDWARSCSRPHLTEEWWVKPTDTRSRSIPPAPKTGDGTRIPGPSTGSVSERVPTAAPSERDLRARRVRAQRVTNQFDVTFNELRQIIVTQALVAGIDTSRRPTGWATAWDTTENAGCTAWRRLYPDSVEVPRRQAHSMVVMVQAPGSLRFACTLSGYNPDRAFIRRRCLSQTVASST